jgi:hypothetical protein
MYGGNFGWHRVVLGSACVLHNPDLKYAFHTHTHKPNFDSQIIIKMLKVGYGFCLNFLHKYTVSF